MCLFRILVNFGKFVVTGFGFLASASRDEISAWGSGMFVQALGKMGS